LNEGQTMANALFLAKIGLAREMNKRQGYLDGEDQKTLLSFALYGDPLATLEEKKPVQKSMVRSRTHPAVKTISDEREPVNQPETLSDELITQVREVVQKYLPGLTDADLIVKQQHCSCQKETSQCPGCQFNAKGIIPQTKGHYVVTLSKEVKVLQHTHYQFARLTFETGGKVLKIVASR
jgi:hypothetical protein